MYQEEHSNDDDTDVEAYVVEEGLCQKCYRLQICQEWYGYNGSYIETDGQIR